MYISLVIFESMKQEPWEIVRGQMSFLYQMGQALAQAKNVEMVSLSEVRDFGQTYEANGQLDRTGADYADGEPLTDDNA